MTEQDWEKVEQEIRDEGMALLEELLREHQDMLIRMKNEWEGK